MVKLNQLKKVHLELIQFLKTIDDVENLDTYINYVQKKLELYSKYKKNCDKKSLMELTRVLNRYRDEFDFDYDSTLRIYEYFDKMDEIIAKKIQP